MAKNEAPKPKWWRAIYDAFKFTTKHDKMALPLIIGLPLILIGAGVAIGFIFGGIAGHIYSNVIAVMLASLAAMWVLTWRTEKAAFAQLDGQLGGSLPAAQTIRRGWTFLDEPVEMDQRSKGIAFLGVGKAGIALIGEGGNSRKVVATARKRITKVVPGVPVHEFYVGHGEGQHSVRELPKAIKKLKKKLTKREREAVMARLRAIGGQRLPIPKGVDPMRARPDRKAMRG